MIKLEEEDRQEISLEESIYEARVEEALVKWDNPFPVEDDKTPKP